MYALKDGQYRKVERIQDIVRNKGGNPDRRRVYWCPICDFSTDSRQLHQGCGGCGATFTEYLPEPEPVPDPEPVAQQVRRRGKTRKA